MPLVYFLSDSDRAEVAQLNGFLQLAQPLLADLALPPEHRPQDFLPRIRAWLKTKGLAKALVRGFFSFVPHLSDVLFKVSLQYRRAAECLRLSRTDPSHFLHSRPLASFQGVQAPQLGPQTEGDHADSRSGGGYSTHGGL